MHPFPVIPTSLFTEEYSEPEPVMGSEPDKTRTTRGYFKIWLENGYFKKMAEIQELGTQNSGLVREVG